MKVDKNFLVYSNYIHIPFKIHKHYCTGNSISGVAQNCDKMRGVAWIDAKCFSPLNNNCVKIIFYTVSCGHKN